MINQQETILSKPIKTNLWVPQKYIWIIFHLSPLKLNRPKLTQINLMVLDDEDENAEYVNVEDDYEDMITNTYVDFFNHVTEK